MATPALFVVSRRCLQGITALLLWLPAPTRAQTVPLPSGAALDRGLSITPFIGWATAVTRKESWSYTDGAGAAVRDQVEMRLADGLAAGLNIQLPVAGPFSLLVGATYIDRDDADFSINFGERWIYTGSQSVLARAGLALDLGQATDRMTVRRLRAALFAAPFYMFEKPQAIANIKDSDLFESARHFGLNIGIIGEVPFARDRVALQLAVDDYLTFWDEGVLQRLPDWLHDAAAGNATTVQADATHQWLLHVGISLRLH
ncbi:MAG: hypothetical protein FIB01_09250 [Gemmatimonadetes bacterium]|nr:hypothetical protein [Gemmatimonadota bacterium]